MKKIFLTIFLGILIFFPPSQVLAGEQTDHHITASLAVDTSGTSPQYLSGIDLSPLWSEDNSTLTTSLLPTSIDTNTPSFVFRFTGGYTPPNDEDLKSINLKLVYKYNVGTLSQHYVVVRYLNSSNQRVTCVSQHTLPIPSSSGTYSTEEFDISSCHEGNGVSTLEVYYFAATLLQPVNTSFDYVAMLVKHGNKTTSSATSSEKTKSIFVKETDVSREGGKISREGGMLNIVFGKNSLPYEVKIDTEKIFSPQVSKPPYLVGNIIKLNVLASFNGYPLPKFNPSLLFLDYPTCGKRPVIKISLDGKIWKNLFTVRAYNPPNRVAAAIKTPGYYAVSCLP